MARPAPSVLALCVGGVGLLGAGCGSPAVGTPTDAGADAVPTGAQVELALRTGAGATLSLPVEVPNPAATIERVTFWIQELRLLGDGAADERAGRDAFLLDLATPIVVSLPEAPPGLYSRLRLDAEPPDADHAPPPVFDGQRLSFRISGHLATGGAFIVQDDEPLVFDARAGDGRELPPGGHLDARLAIDPTVWLAGVGLGDARTGTVVIDHGRADALATFRKNLAAAVALSFAAP